MPYNSLIRSAIQRAVKTGELVKSDQCEICGSSGRIVAHHWNGYNDPLDIWWVCIRCNNNMKGPKFHSGVLSLEQAKSLLSDLYQCAMMNVKKLTQQEQEALEYIVKADGQGITWQDLAEHLNLEHNHASTLLLKLAKGGWLNRRHIEAGRHSHFEYWPADGQKG